MSGAIIYAPNEPIYFVLYAIMAFFKNVIHRQISRNENRTLIVNVSDLLEYGTVFCFSYNLVCKPESELTTITSSPPPNTGLISPGIKDAAFSLDNVS